MAKSIPAQPATKRTQRQTCITFTEDTKTPAHYPTFSVSVTVEGEEVEAGDLTGMNRSDWVYMIQKYLEHRLCPTCPGSTAAKRSASSTPASPPAARKPHRPK